MIQQCKSCPKPKHVTCRDWRYIHHHNCDALSDKSPVTQRRVNIIHAVYSQPGITAPELERTVPHTTTTIRNDIGFLLRNQIIRYKSVRTPDYIYNTYWPNE